MLVKLKREDATIMMAATHRLGGAAIGVLTAQCLLRGEQEILLYAVVTGGAVLGSLIPDIDNSKSFISRKVPLVSLFVSLFQTIIRGISNLLPRKGEKYIRSVVGHRGVTHSLLLCFLIGGLLNLVGFAVIKNSSYFYFALGVVVGMLSHLLLDMFAGGVPLFCPFSVKRITLARIKTGGAVEWVLRTAAVAIFVLFLKNKFF